MPKGGTLHKMRSLERKYDRSCGWCFLLVFVVPRHLEPVVPEGNAVFLQILSIKVKDEKELWRNAINRNRDTTVVDGVVSPSQILTRQNPDDFAQIS